MLFYMNIGHHLVLKEMTYTQLLGERYHGGCLL
jgi:hypothetical protein